MISVDLASFALWFSPIAAVGERRRFPRSRELALKKAECWAKQNVEVPVSSAKLVKSRTPKQTTVYANWWCGLLWQYLAALLLTSAAVGYEIHVCSPVRDHISLPPADAELQSALAKIDETGKVGKKVALTIQVATN
ncbi:MAG: hypothetical protein ABGZ35_04295 [Planctomycetaceae bacterium]